MPNKNINRKREVARNWYYRNKEKKLAYNKAVKAAKKSHSINQKCSVENCISIGERHHPDYDRPTYIIWLCKKHHEDVHSTRKCKLCERKHVAIGLCKVHYRRHKVATDPDFLARKRADQRKYKLKKKMQKLGDKTV